MSRKHRYPLPIRVSCVTPERMNGMHTLVEPGALGACNPRATTTWDDPQGVYGSVLLGAKGPGDQPHCAPGDRGIPTKLILPLRAGRDSAQWR